jgi:putative flippase GtrA
MKQISARNLSLKIFGDENFYKYLITGFVNTITTYSIYISLLQIISIFYAYSTAYIIGLFIGLFFHSKFVFKVKINIYITIIYLMFYLFNYFFSGILLWLFVEKFYYSKVIAPLLVLFISIPINFFLTKLIFYEKPLTIN